MCNQCLVNPLSFGEPMPGWYLMRARRNHPEWKQGDWGLVQCNDPTFTWSLTPTPCPLWGMTDDEEDAWFETAEKDSPEYWRALDVFSTPEYAAYEKQFFFPPDTGYELVIAAIQVGYDPKRFSLKSWLFDYLGEWLKTANMQEDGDPFPDLENTIPSDLTIGRDPIKGEPHYKE